MSDESESREEQVATPTRLVTVQSDDVSDDSDVTNITGATKPSTFTMFDAKMSSRTGEVTVCEEKENKEKKEKKKKSKPGFFALFRKRRTDVSETEADQRMSTAQAQKEDEVEEEGQVPAASLTSRHTGHVRVILSGATPVDITDRRRSNHVTRTFVTAQ